jgi:hypothetical protein
VPLQRGALLAWSVHPVRHGPIIAGNANVGKPLARRLPRRRHARCPAACAPIPPMRAAAPGMSRPASGARWRVFQAQRAPP